MPRPSTSTTTTTTTRPTTTTSSASLSAAPPPTRRKSKSPNLAAAHGPPSTTTTTPMSRTASSRSGGAGSTAMSRTTSTSTSTSSTSTSTWGVQWLTSVLAPPDDPAPAPTTSSSSSTHPRRRGRRRDDAPHPQHHKRATSPDPDTTAAAGEEEEEQEQSILVYVHPVKPTDTLEGIAITYNTTRDALRRANGMWAQDGVGTRKTLLLPVDECGTKGATVSAPPPRQKNDERAGQEGEGEGEGEEAEEEAAAAGKRYKHHSYVAIPHVGTIQIARLPRKKLSYFPPRRRRSHRSRTHSVSPGSRDDDDYSAHRSLLSPPHVFAGLTAGVGDLHPHTTHTHPHGQHTRSEQQTVTIGPTFKTLSELAADTAVGLENVGSVVEGFVRRWTVKASDFVGGDLIELTQRLGFDEGQGMERSLSGGGGGGGTGGGSGRAAGGGGGSGGGTGVERRVVRERLPRREGERRKVL